MIYPESKWHPGYIIWENLTDITGANLNAIMDAIMAGEHHTKPGLVFQQTCLLT